jgi:beta-galactosidase/beta-glucuronidase
MGLKTIFSENLSFEHPLQEYPRPTMQRDSYINLNGYWDYAITNSKKKPLAYDGQIIVPFSPESDLSGVNHKLLPSQFLWYHRTIHDPRTDKNQRVLLHFGAVDQYCAVYLNQKLVVKHQGGYLPFHTDITDFLTENENDLVVLVRDASDTSYHSRGKQKLKSSGMFYTAQSGIWQTVFMECVPSTYIESLRITPQYDDSTVDIQLTIAGASSDEKIEGLISIRDDIGSFYEVFDLEAHTVIPLPNFTSWSPEHPYLYHATIFYGQDTVHTYFAMRKISTGTDDKGIMRIHLNNRPYFQNGLLDQGYWPESLYTAPSDEALIYDITTAKSLGFNLLRKHAKIEPERWYYHCDRLGMLVWQDMVNGGSCYHSWFVTYFPTIFPKLATLVNDNNYFLSSRTNEAGRTEFQQESEEMITHLYHHPCIVMWVPFNEGWGQFDTVTITKKIHRLDPTRLVDSSSGWFDQKCGDVRSLHIYFTAMKFHPEKRPVVLSEFGGYTLRVPEHTFCDSTYGYRHYKNKEDLTNAIVTTYEKKLLPGIEHGLCATVYTQVSDIEEEINGLMTYDRKILKVEPDKIKAINEKLNHQLS